MCVCVCVRERERERERLYLLSDRNSTERNLGLNSFLECFIQNKGNFKTLNFEVLQAYSF